LDTPLWLAAAVFVAMAAAVVEAAYLDARDGRYLGLAVVGVLGGLTVLQYAARLVAVVRLARHG